MDEEGAMTSAPKFATGLQQFNFRLPCGGLIEVVWTPEGLDVFSDGEPLSIENEEETNERDEALARCRKYVDDLDEARRVAITAEQERDRLRAALEPTPENVAAIIASIEEPDEPMWDAVKILAAIRAKVLP